MLKIWDYEMRGPPPPAFQSMVGHTGTVRTVLITPDGQRIISTGDDGAILMWRFLADTVGADGEWQAPDLFSVSKKKRQGSRSSTPASTPMTSLHRPRPFAEGSVCLLFRPLLLTALHSLCRVFSKRKHPTSLESLWLWVGSLAR